MAEVNMNAKESYTYEMQQRIIDLQIKKNKSDHDVANGTGISLSRYTDFKRMDGDKPKRKKVETAWIHRLAEYYNVSYDYVRGLSDNPHKDKKHNVVKSPFTFTNPRMLEKVYHEIQQLPQEDKDLLFQFFIFTKPSIRRAAFKFGRLIYEDWRQEAMASFLGQCSDIPGLRASLMNGVHDGLFINALILLQDGESHVAKKRYRQALIKYLSVVQLIAREDMNKKPDLLLLGITACNNIEAIEKSWISFPFSKDSNIMRAVRSFKSNNFAHNSRTESYTEAVNEGINELSKTVKRSEEEKKK